MKLPRVRFTVRRMMVAVAIIGLIFGVAEMMRRRARFANEAETWALLADLFERGRFISVHSPTDIVPKPPARFAAYYRMMAEKYRVAARFPFLPVPPDPPEPE
jgi:hypothetical protein